MMCPYVCEKSIDITNNTYNKEQINTSNVQISLDIMMQCKEKECAVWNEKTNRCKYNGR